MDHSVGSLGYVAHEKLPELPKSIAKGRSSSKL